jgi:hypothetical protein
MTTPRRKPPPYAHHLTGDRSNSLAVVIGSKAWERAKLPGWFPGRKVLLPPGEDPAGLDWSFVTGWPDIIIFAAGDPPPLSAVTALAAEILRHGRNLQVLYVEPEAGRIRRIKAAEGAE